MSAIRSSPSTTPPSIWPALASVYREHGYEAGFSRGVNQTMAVILEATEEFVRQFPERVDEHRRLLHQFSRFVEQRLDRCNSSSTFVDGAGI